MAYPIIFGYGFKKSAQFQPKRTLEDDRFSILGRQGNIWDENGQDLIWDNNEDFLLYFEKDGRRNVMYSWGVMKS